MNHYWTEVLFEALWDGDPRLLGEAVRKGADIESLDEKGNTVMSVAVANGMEMTRAALSHGANPNQRDADGNTCLRSAVQIGDAILLECLLSGGAVPEAENPKDGSTSLHVAAEKGSADCLLPLVKRATTAQLNRFDYVSRTPLTCAVMKGHIECAAILINGGCNVNARDSARLGDTALAFAVDRLDLPMVKLLCRYGADPTIEGNMADSPLEKARRISSPQRGEILAVLQESTSCVRDSA